VADWITADDLPPGLPTPPGGEDAAARHAAAASGILYALSGRRWSGRATRTIEARPIDGTTCGGGYLPVPVLCRGQVINHSRCDRPPALRLPDYPVQSVAEVRAGGALRDPDTYRLTGSRFLEDAWGGWLVCDTAARLTITYDHGADPPDAGRLAAARLAAELVKAAAGVGSDLPGYITQRVRQGETISYTSAAALFDKGRTGLADVDLWLATVNPSGLRRRSSVWSPDTDPRYTTTGGTP